MTKLRKLNLQGIDQFKNYIEGGAVGDIPINLLESEGTSDEIEDNIELEQTVFESRYELGVYLTDKFREINMQPYLGDSGFWSAIALFWFNQLVPQKSDGKRNPSKWYNYVFWQENFRWRPRHAIFSTWKLVSQHGENVRFILNKEVHIRGELSEQFLGRIEYFTFESVAKTASKLYTDTETGGFVTGAAGRLGGSASRYINWLQQIELTYDLQLIDSENLYQLLPQEFDPYRET